MRKPNTTKHKANPNNSKEINKWLFRVISVFTATIFDRLVSTASVSDFDNADCMGKIEARRGIANAQSMATIMEVDVSSPSMGIPVISSKRVAAYFMPKDAKSKPKRMEGNE
jgi:hypothetical protein